MLWAFILAAVVWMFYRFFSDVKEQGDKVAKEGGMTKKYALLMEYILSGHPNSRIFNQSKTHVLAGVAGPSGNTTFEIVQLFDKIKIIYTLDSIVFGKKSLSWEFADEMDQMLMLRQINKDLEKFNNDLISKYS